MGNKTLKIIGIVAGAAVVVVGLWLRFMPDKQGASVKQMQVGGQSLAVEVADTDFLKQQGLSNRASLAPDSGMLFIYPDQAIRYFWMKDMKFPLDVLWLAGNRVVGLQENIPIKTNNGQVVRFQSNAPSDMVLEVNAGWIRSQGVKTGDMVVYN